jgi:hypothetical protein
MGGHFIRGAILKIPRFSAGIASWGMVDLCSAHTDGLDGFASFQNEHGRCFSDARDAFELSENEVAKSLHVANPQAKDVIEVACYQQALRNFRLAMDRRQKFSDVVWSLSRETNGHDHTDAQPKRGRIDPSAIAGDDASPPVVALRADHMALETAGHAQRGRD